MRLLLLFALLQAATSADARQIDAPPAPQGEVAASTAPVAPDVHQGALEPSDPQLDDGEHYDVYRLDAAAGETVEAVLTSDAFDAYLVVRSPSGAVVQDDDSGGNRNARLVIPTAEEGTYAVVVTSYAGGETGAYRLALTASGAPTPGEAPGPDTMEPATRAADAPAAATPPVTPAPGAGGLSGTYLHITGYGTHLYRTFFPNGLVYRGVPAGGPEVFTVETAQAAAAAGDPRNLGTYSLDGGTLTSTWSDGPVTQEFGRTSYGITLDGYNYQAYPAYPDGHRLDGTYTTRSYNSMDIAGGGSMQWGGAGTVAFRPDGTFDYGRSGFATSNGTAASGESSTAGRYAIRGQTITFTFDDGSVQHALLLPWNGEERMQSPSSLNLNGRTYMLQD